MAKKFGKFMLFTAAIGGAAAAAYYYFKKKDAENDWDEDEDYDDFSEDLDEDTDASKNYVTLTPEAGADTEEKKDSFVPLNQVAQNAGDKKTDTETSDKADPDVEEFFDEEDEAGTEPPINDN